jgi:hypothetical protein
VKIVPPPLTPEHTCCYHVAAAKSVLADRERELLELKGPCSGGQVGVGPCRLHYAHSGPCDIRAANHHARLAAGTEQ